MVRQTKIENFMDNNLNIYFSFVPNKLICILLVAILYFQHYKKIGLYPHFKNTSIAPKSAGIGPFGLY